MSSYKVTSYLLEVDNRFAFHADQGVSEYKKTMFCEEFLALWPFAEVRSVQAYLQSVRNMFCDILLGIRMRSLNMLLLPWVQRTMHKYIVLL